MARLTLQLDRAGIIVCTDDRNWEALARRIDTAILAEEPLRGKLIQVNRPSR